MREIGSEFCLSEIESVKTSNVLFGQVILILFFQDEQRLKQY